MPQTPGIGLAADAGAARNDLRRTAVDAAAVLALAVVVFYVALSFDAFEEIYEFSRQYEAWEIDELITLAVVLTLALTVFAIRRVSDVSRSARAARRMARTDALTGLSNRYAFNEHLTSGGFRRSVAAHGFGVIYVDLNDFKLVNDVAGHLAGDKLLRCLADRFRSALPHEVFTARVGGDEFNFVLTGPRVGERTAEVADLIRLEIVPAFAIDSHRYFVTGSVGFAVSGGEVDVAEMARRADVAMMRAKETRTNEPVCWTPDFEADSTKVHRIGEALRRALAAEELELHYQPIVECDDHGVPRVEALLRWTSGELGPVSPETFIPVAERTGLIGDIGRWTLSRVCEDLARWPDLRVNVNVSPVQLRAPDFAATCTDIARSAGVDPHRIALELTEGIVVSNPELAKLRLKELRDAGFFVMLDDFGTGFASIGYLREFAFDGLKIDQSFVSEVGRSDQANKYLQSFSLIAQALDVDVIAEGVENEDQARLVALLGCRWTQGYWYGKPLPFDELCRRFRTDDGRLQADPTPQPEGRTTAA